jgi:hypothetical protein
VKHDLRHKASVADGHVTQVPKDSFYSGVVSLRSLRIAILAAELNDLLSSVFTDQTTKAKGTRPKTTKATEFLASK